jgi:hypothetical protein
MCYPSFLFHSYSHPAEAHAQGRFQRKPVDKKLNNGRGPTAAYQTARIARDRPQHPFQVGSGCTISPPGITPPRGRGAIVAPRGEEGGCPRAGWTYGREAAIRPNKLLL